MLCFNMSKKLGKHQKFRSKGNRQMRKSKYFPVLGLLILLVAVLAGCGGGPGDNPSIRFAMPSTYVVLPDQNSYAAISGNKKVKFYTLKEQLSEDPDYKINADYTFSGTTGGSYLQFSLPESLINQKRYIAAMVIVDENDTFDLQGKTKTDIENAVKEGVILFGMTASDSGANESVRLTKGSTISNLKFFGVMEENQAPAPAFPTERQ
jgi:hypothetical protein